MNSNFKQVVYCPTYVDQKIVMNSKDVAKLEQAIQVHGYRGSSKMKHNGCVIIKPTDIVLLKSLSKFKNNLKNEPIFSEIKKND